MKNTPQKPKRPAPTNATENRNNRKHPAPTNSTANRDNQQPKPEQPEGDTPISYQWLKQSLSFTQTGNAVSLLERRLQGTDKTGGCHDRE